MPDMIDINVPDIEKELERLLKSSKDKKQIKACLFTLIIYAHEPRRTNYLQELVDTILDKFPCRIIFIQADSQSDTSYLHADVANVTSGQTDAMVVCDQITIRASSDQLFRVPYVVIPHIVPDLPVHLLWSQTPFEEHAIFPALQPYASRIIFDSECSDNLHRFCEEMLHNLDRLKMDVMDINWALVSNWRDVLAQLFDTPKKLEELKHCKTLRIIYNDTKTDTLLHPEIRAIYLQGWVAARLKWNYSTTESFKDNLIISYTTEDQPKIITLCPEKRQDLSPGAIISIEINSVDGQSYSIARKEAISQVLIHASSLEKCELPFTLPLPNVHYGLTFMKEIFYHKLSRHYRETLQVLTHMDPNQHEQ